MYERNLPVSIAHLGKNWQHFQTTSEETVELTAGQVKSLSNFIKRGKGGSDRKTYRGKYGRFVVNLSIWSTSKKGLGCRRKLEKCFLIRYAKKIIRALFFLIEFAIFRWCTLPKWWTSTTMFPKCPAKLILNSFSTLPIRTFSPICSRFRMLPRCRPVLRWALPFVDSSGTLWPFHKGQTLPFWTLKKKNLPRLSLLPEKK